MPSLVTEDLSQPGTHAFIIGVSHYPHLNDGEFPTPDGQEFGIGQLASAARSASEFAAWVKNEYYNPNLPLKSLRVLLSPSEGEQIHPDIEKLLSGDFAATRHAVEQNLVEFKNACDRHKENVAIVYVAGHGVQITKHGSIVLLHDFAKPGQLTKLTGAIDMASVHAGMNHPNTAQNQFWFIDACRQTPLIAHKFELLTGALTLDGPKGDAKASPLFLAATTGRAAYGRPGGVSLFNEALLWALRDAGAAEGPGNGVQSWHVPVTRLIRDLPVKVNTLAEKYGESQPVDIAGKVHEAILHTYAATPQVTLSINLLPPDAKATSRATLSLNGRVPIITNNTSWPLEGRVDAGLYALDIISDPPYKGLNDIIDVKPPLYLNDVEVN